MARVEIHKEVPKELKIGEWNLCFQKVTYHYDDGSMQDGFRFIWGAARWFATSSAWLGSHREL